MTGPAPPVLGYYESQSGVTDPGSLGPLLTGVGALTEPRTPDERLWAAAGTSRSLFVAMARAGRWPARARVGFATYFEPGLLIDHVVAEVWDGDAGRWRLIDAQLADGHVDPTDGVTLDPLDLPRDRFVVAGEAWRRCRAGTAEPDRFLVGSDVDVPETCGWPYLRHNLVHDLAALNKVEMLLRDAWGLADGPQPDAPVVTRPARRSVHSCHRRIL